MRASGYVIEQGTSCPIGEMHALTLGRSPCRLTRRLAQWRQFVQSPRFVGNVEVELIIAEVTAPVDVCVIKPAHNPGQTLAAQFQTPELFVVAPGLREKVHVFAFGYEADIGLISRGAKREIASHVSLSTPS